MTRFNSFNIIHKALRAMMYDAALTLQQTDFTDKIETATAVKKVEDVIHYFEQHAHHEDNFMLPAIEEYAPEVVESFEKEHVADIELGNRLVTLLNMLKSTETDPEKVNCGSAINKSFRDFMVFNINHMAKEETDINKILWENYTDEELMALNGKLVATIPPNELMEEAAWMLKGINKNEAIMWLKGVKAKAPAFFFDQIFALTHTCVPERFRAAVQDAVMEEETVAA